MKPTLLETPCYSVLTNLLMTSNVTHVAMIQRDTTAMIFV